MIIHYIQVYKLLYENQNLTVEQACKRLRSPLKSDIHQKLKKTNFDSNRIEIPIVSIPYSPKIVEALQMELNRQKYNCIVCSDEPFTNALFISREIDAKKQLAFYSNMIETSLILLVSNDTDWCDALSDCCVRLAENIRFNSYNGYVVILPENADGNNIKNFIRYLAKLGE